MSTEKLLPPTGPVVRFDLRQVLQVDARSARKLERPPVLPVEKDGDPRSIRAVDKRVAQLFSSRPSSAHSRKTRVFSWPAWLITAAWNFSHAPRDWRSWKYMTVSAPWATA